LYIDSFAVIDVIELLLNCMTWLWSQPNYHTFSQRRPRGYHSWPWPRPNET